MEVARKRDDASSLLSPSPTLPIFFFKRRPFLTASGGASPKVQSFFPFSLKCVLSAFIRCTKIAVTLCGFVMIRCVAMHLHRHLTVWSHSLISHSTQLHYNQFHERMYWNAVTLERFGVSRSHKEEGRRLLSFFPPKPFQSPPFSFPNSKSI